MTLKRWPEPDPPLTRSYSGDQCWVCAEYFIDHPKGTDPAVLRNCHHVVPRAYGGLNGPTVMVCSAHHDLLHVVADAMYAEDTAKAKNLLQDLEEIPTKRRVLYLASVVWSAQRETGKDPNKRGQVNLVLTPATRRELESLAQLYKTSQAKLIQHMIHARYVQDFPIANQPSSK